jgi:hypothetical protein
MVIISGLVIRLVLAPFFAHPFDVYVWYESGQDLLNGTKSIWSFMVPYFYSYFLFAFPAAILFRSLSEIFGSYPIPISSLNPLLNPGAPWNITVVPGLLFDLLVKLPLIASDTIIATLLYRVVMRCSASERMATSASLAWFLNPLVIWVSSGWGTFDTLPTLFTVLSLYFILEKRFAYSGLALIVAIAMKYYAIVLVIPLLLIAWKEGNRNGIVKLLSSMAIASLVLFAPFFSGVTLGLSQVVGTSQSGLSYSGLSFWSAITLFISVSNQSILSAGLIAVFLAVAYYWMARRRPNGPYSYVIYFSLSIIPVLLLYRFVAENYFVWWIPFASILTVQNSRGRALFWILSGVALLSSMTDSLLPYYMLPMAPWIGRYLVDLLSFLSPYRIASSGSIPGTLSVGKIFLAGLGILTSALLALITINFVSAENRAPSPKSESIADDLPAKEIARHYLLKCYLWIARKEQTREVQGSYSAE